MYRKFLITVGSFTLLIALVLVFIRNDTVNQEFGQRQKDDDMTDTRQRPSVQNSQIDTNLTRYQRVRGISGNLNSVGSDTMNNLMTFWAGGFRRYYPVVRIQVDGKGSSTAPPALIERTAQLGPMSRAMRATEIDQFNKKFGYNPTQLRVANDALAVFVHKDNPIKCLTLGQVDSMFSNSRRRGYGPVSNWGDLGLIGTWANQHISLYGRNSASGTYGFFKESILLNGDYKNTVKEQPGSASVVQSVGAEIYAVGYSGIGYMTSNVQTVSLAVDSNGECIEAMRESVLSGKYPLARFLYLYIDKPPNKSLSPLALEFIKFIFSQEGQQEVIKDGYFPVSAEVALEELAKIQ